MSQRTTRSRLRRDILKKRGITKVKRPPVSNPSSSIKISKLVPLSSQFDDLKTTRMRLIEGEQGIPIEELLTSDSNMAAVARRLGLKSRATVLKWKRRLGL